MLFSDSRQITSETSLNCQNNLYILNVNATQEEDKICFQYDIYMPELDLDMQR